VSDPLSAILHAVEQESRVWSSSLLAPERREAVVPWAPLCGERFAPGLEAIYEGYLLHHGRPRLFDASDASAALLCGDFLYALGLHWIAALHDVEAIAALADLIALAAHLRAVDGAAGDGPLWAATARHLQDRSDAAAFAAAKDELRRGAGDAALRRLLDGTAEPALRLHAARTSERPRNSPPQG
jgi:hypothetical protein